MNDYSVAVFGAGISGTAIANELAKMRLKVLLIDPYVSENAPGPPAALVNPATGLRAKLSWRAEECYEALKNQILEISRETGKNNLISDSGIIRPAISKKLVQNFQDALHKYDWPENWIQWLDEEEIRQLNPEIATNFGGILVKCGFTVFVDRYLNAYRAYLRQNGVTCRYEEAESEYKPDQKKFQINLITGEKATAQKIVMAVGHHIKEFEDWENLPLDFVKGQVVHFEAEDDLAWEHAVSARGYTIRRGKRELIVGSTYEHNFNDLNTSNEGYQKIQKKLEWMLPPLSKRVRKKNQIAGVRVTTPNRLPVIGQHPEIQNLFIYTGMNSKGLLFSHYVAKLLAANMIQGTDVPGELDIARYFKEK